VCRASGASHPQGGHVEQGSQRGRNTARQRRHVDPREIDKGNERQAEHGRHDTEIRKNLTIPDDRFQFDCIGVDGEIAPQEMQ